MKGRRNFLERAFYYSLSLFFLSSFYLGAKTNEVANDNGILGRMTPSQSRNY
jgi:hypothetical protein